MRRMVGKFGSCITLNHLLVVDAKILVGIHSHKNRASVCLGKREVLHFTWEYEEKHTTPKVNHCAVLPLFAKPICFTLLLNSQIGFLLQQVCTINITPLFTCPFDFNIIQHLGIKLNRTRIDV